MSLFTPRGSLTRNQAIGLAIFGIGVILGIWYLLTAGANPVVPRASMPSPGRVLRAYADLYNDNELIKNTTLSIGLNLAGYIEEILTSIPIGFLIGLIPFFRGSFHREVDAIRYVPLTALIGIFIVWFGVGTAMKVHFLAFGIIIYLLPVVIQRIDEVNDVYLKTVYTLGATSWQTVRTVYFPSVMSRLSDDIRVLTAISWTYIIVIEGVGSTGGVGALIWRAGLRQWRIDKVFALLLLIMLIGVIQDKIFIRLDRHFFPYKYQARDQEKTGMIRKQRMSEVIFDYAMDVFWWIVIAIYLLLVVNSLFPFLAGLDPLGYLFGDTVWVVHLVMIIAIFYTLRTVFVKIRKKPVIA